MTQEEIDSLVNQKAAVEEELANLKQENDLLKLKAKECADMLEQQAANAQIKGKYFVIAGSFKKSDNAANYSVKVKNMGGDGRILAGPYDFNLVVYSAHETLKEAAGSMRELRQNDSPDAWVYMER
jgi:hypothetical protein